MEKLNKYNYVEVPPYPQTCSSCGFMRPFGNECPKCDRDTDQPKVGTGGEFVGFSHCKSGLINEREVKRANK